MALSAGAARVDITPRTPNYLHGYYGRNHAHEGVHDPLSLRALWVRNSAGTDVVIISADILWFGNVAAGQIRTLCKAQLGVPPAQVFLAGTHTHSAPVVSDEHVNKMGEAYVNKEWFHLLIAQAVAAAAIARTRQKPVRLRLARGASHIGVNRRELNPKGKIILGKDQNGPCDRELIGVAIDDLDGRPLARIANFACHGVVLSEENYLVSGDWCGLAERAIEQRLDESPVLFLSGGTGNINPRIGPQNDFGPVEELAGEFTQDFFKLDQRWQNMSEKEDHLAGVEMALELPRKPEQKTASSSATKTVTLHGLRLGPVQILGFPGELFSETTMGVKQAAGANPVMVCSYVDGSEDGYIPVREAYAFGGYEVKESPYAETAEALLRQGFLELLARLG